MGTLTLVLAGGACSNTSTTDDGSFNLGATGSAGGGGGTADGAVDGDAAKTPLDCTAIHGGPTMVEVSTPNGDRYCIDSTKVTQKQYAEFLASTKAKPGSEHASCGWNESYGPRFHDDSTSGGGCFVGPGAQGGYKSESDWFSPDTTPSRPMVCIDWCDAVAFCEWAGKRLCGKRGGGTLTSSQFASADVSEWYNACSNQGSTAYPYGDQYKADCGLGTTGALPDVDGASACHAASGMFAKVYGMSGMTSEWIDACGYAPNAGMFLCVAPGSAGSAEVSRCDFPGLIAPQAGDASSGFRCCKG